VCGAPRPRPRQLVFFAIRFIKPVQFNNMLAIGGK